MLKRNGQIGGSLLALAAWTVAPLVATAQGTSPVAPQTDTPPTIVVQTDEAQPATLQRKRFITLRQKEQPAEQPYLVDLAAGEAPPPKPSVYWIGIQLASGTLPDLLKTQLKLDHGLVVVEVFPDSPAAKAGLVANDILLQIGDQPLAEPAELIAAIEAFKGQPLVVELLHGGKRRKVEVTPIKRPEPTASETKAETRTPEELRAEMKKLEEALRAIEAPGASYGMFFLRPGVVGGNINIQREVGKLPDVPANMSLQIKKEGDKPAKIIIKRDGNTWETTEDKLDALPEDVRKHVQKLLSGGQVAITSGSNTLSFQNLNLAGVPHIPAMQHFPAPQAAPPVTTYRDPIPYVTQVNPPATHNPAPPAFRAEPPTRFPSAEKPNALDAKLDAILKKLDQLTEERTSAMQREIKQLRSDLDELRKK